jgi:hypothetical protein
MFKVVDSFSGAEASHGAFDPQIWGKAQGPLSLV